jgi:ankyrin repeat protein
VGFWLRSARNQTVEFERALYSGNVSRVEELLKSHPSLANAKNMESEWQVTGRKQVPANGWTALHVAAYLGDPEMVKLLVKYHANVNARDKRGLTPLLWTAFGGHSDSAAVLLSNGADINARGPDGRSTIDLAKLSLDSKMLDLLRERGAKE